MAESSHEIAIKRAYDPPVAGDGVRVLVDRLWPRGLRKDAAHFDQWRKDLSPSTELRQFYGHRPERFAEFSRRYLAELRNKDATEAIAELIDLNQHRAITLLTASRDLTHSEAAVLAKHVQRLIKRRSSSRPRSAASR
jgi:uncharacterized protein YeaO (DUF488 family)